MVTEREELMAQVGMRASVASCSTCGEDVWRQPTIGATAVLGPALFGNVCVPCGAVYCDQCIKVGGPTPCPQCGKPTLPAGQRELRQIGITI
jgi:hypothetical protein